MQLISAARSVFVKRVFPFIVIIGACAWTYWSNRQNPNAFAFAMVFCVISASLMAVALGRGPWRLADKVVDCGDKLVITRWRTRIEVPIANVRELLREAEPIGSKITLILDTPSALGNKVAFLAPDKRRSPDIDAALDALSRRIESQRGNRVT